MKNRFCLCDGLFMPAGGLYKSAVVSLLFVFIVPAFLSYAEPFSFKDDLGRTVTVNSCKNTAVLQGSLSSIWLLAGGEVRGATADCFSEPPEVTEQEASQLNIQWNTDAFYAHKAGFVEKNERTVNLGSMMNPNAELILSADTDFVIMSANISGHKKLASLFENAGIPCAFFRIETFSDYLNMLGICCSITGRDDLFKKNGTDVKDSIENIIRSSLDSASSPTVLLLRSSSANVSAKSSDNNMTGAMLKELGAVNIADGGKTFTENLSIEKIIAEDPEYIFVTTMGADSEKSIGGYKSKLESNPLWKELSAVRNGRVYILPKELFHYKPGVRWDKSYSILAGIINSNT